jgi:hypothetical protein
MAASKAAPMKTESPSSMNRDTASFIEKIFLVKKPPFQQCQIPNHKFQINDKWLNVKAFFFKDLDLLKFGF